MRSLSLSVGTLLVAASASVPAAAAHRRASPPPAAHPAPPPPPPPAAAPSQPPPGDFAHTPAAEQATNTPLPIYVEASGVQVSRVVVKYRGAQMKAWVRLEMKRMGNGWAALIPCADVQPGSMLYWIQGFDPSCEPAASSGDPKQPFTVPIRDTITSEAPHLPGRAPPQACTDQAPPPEEPAEEPAQPKAPAPSSEDATGTGSETRTGGTSFARWWFGVAGAVDFAVLSGGNDVCAVDSNGTPISTTYACTNPSGSDFTVTRATPLIPGYAGDAPGGIHVGDLRVLAAADFAVSASFLLGLRVGYVANTYPSGGAAVTAHRAFGPPLHLEARATYLFGDAPLARTGFAPAVFVGAGVAPFDAHVTSTVSVNDGQGRVPITSPVTVWRTSGPGFIAAGGGFRYQLSQRAAFQAALRLDLAFGAGALFGFGPELGFQYGF